MSATESCDNAIIQFLLNHTSIGGISRDYIIYGLNRKYPEQMIGKRLNRLVEKQVVKAVLGNYSHTVKYRLNKNRRYF